MTGFRLGAFELQRRLASGGMGDVWSGAHIVQGVPVAAKVLRPPETPDARSLELFRREVRAVAQLDHPGIITLFDIGAVPPESARASRGGVSAHSPYLVMELVAGGSLADTTSPMPWKATREVLFGVLDALAHAHARGITHLDIKPGNILRAGKPAGFPIRLTDFGIASFRASLPSQDELVLGTPGYMAPEQFFGEWREFGPWTDLYALGCVAYELCTGRLPFESGSTVRLGAAHLREAPPALHPPSDYPPGFEEWVMRLLEKDPARRHRRCASAAAELVALTAERTTGRETERETERETGHETGHQTVRVAEHAPMSTAIPAATAAGSPHDGGVRAEALEPIWRGQAPPARPFNLIGAGLQLFGLRTVPLVGRTAECEMLWRSFRSTVARGQPGAFVLTGAAGVGKSRLTSWFCERAHELGAAELLTSDHRGSEPRAPAISAMMARAWSCLDMTAPELRRRVATRLARAGVDSPALHDAMAELLAPAALGIDYVPGMFHSFPSRATRYRALAHVLQQVYQGRPVVIALDDVHADPDALRFIQFAMHAAMPLWAVVTVREDLAAESLVVPELLRDLEQHANTERLELQPLSPADSRRLVRNLLYLDGDLAEGVATRSGGNPLYATQLVGDWVDRGILRADTSGFVLSGPDAPAVPRDLQAVWSQRVERVLDECVADEDDASAAPAVRHQLQLALELAAALRGDVDMAEWLAVCARVGIGDPRPVLERLLASRMASVNPGGWSFDHRMLRDTIEGTARDNGRWVAHNRECAHTLEALRPVPHWGDPERIGRHHFAAGQFEQACRPLFTGAKERMRVEDYATALELAVMHDRAFDAMGLAADDARRQSGLLLQAEIRFLREELADASALATRVADSPESAQTMRAHGLARLTLARVQQREGRSNAALRSFKDAERTLRKAGANPQLGVCLSEQATAMLELGLVADAWDAVHEAQQIFEDAGRLTLWMESQLSMARLVSRLGEYQQAKALCRRVLAAARRDGLGRIEATACNALAEVELEHGALADAEESLNASIDLFEQLGFRRLAQSASLSRILLLLETGSWAHAEQRADELTGVPEIELSRVSRLTMSLIRLTLAADGPDTVFDRHLQQANTLLAQVDRPMPSMARCVAMALARVARQPQRQRQVEGLRDIMAERLHDGSTYRPAQGSD